MIQPFPAIRPNGAARRTKGKPVMKTVLHIGAHRCATTTFQTYMRSNASDLTQRGVAFWGPLRTRTGLFRGIQPDVVPLTPRDLRRRATGRVRLNCDRLRQTGHKALVVSDENMIGTIRSNLNTRSLYPAAGERVARFAAAFGPHLSSVVLNIRAQEWYWASALGFGLTRGRRLPSAYDLEAFAANPRRWRDVITDLACALGDIPLQVIPFETYAGRPEAQLQMMSGQSSPEIGSRIWQNATPRLPQLRAFQGGLPPGTGRWQPFSIAQRSAMRAAYAADLEWLRNGADGLAQLRDDRSAHTDNQVGLNRPTHRMTRGSNHDQEDRRMA